LVGMSAEVTGFERLKRSMNHAPTLKKYISCCRQIYSRD